MLIVAGAVSTALWPPRWLAAGAGGVDRSGDFAGGVSSNSSNLAWGGIKYLETHEYLLVNKLCKCAPPDAWPIPFHRQGNPVFTIIQRGFSLRAPFFRLPGQSPVLDHGTFSSPAPHYISARAIERQSR